MSFVRGLGELGLFFSLLFFIFLGEKGEGKEEIGAGGAETLERWFLGERMILRVT